MSTMEEPTQFTSHYQSPLGKILLAADGYGLTGLWFEGQRYFPFDLEQRHQEEELPLFTRAKDWLDVYFSGKEPPFTPPLHFVGTRFRCEVWKILCSIPYGQTTTYGEIARLLAVKLGVPKMSARAVGAAVGRNRISIIVPCHRVVGLNGELIGYAGGIDRKLALLKLENANPVRPHPSQDMQDERMYEVTSQTSPPHHN